MTRQFDAARLLRDLGATTPLGVVNLYALRSSEPAIVRDHELPIGDENNAEIERRVAEAGVVVAAWGAFPWAKTRADEVLASTARQKPVFSLGLTKNGFPRHPLYVNGATTPRPFGATRPDEVYTHFGLD